LDSTTVQDIFLDCRSDWARLKSTVFGPTGCNSTGTQLLRDVWQNYINGGKLKFQNKVVAMYIFATWHAAGRDLPELCNRTLPSHQQLRIGVPELNPSFTTPTKINSSSSSSTKAAKKGDALADIARALQNFTGNSSSPITPPDNTTMLGAKRSILPEEPDMELAHYMQSHNIMKWWPQIYEKLGITNIADLQFIGKKECLQSLASLPTLPRLKMALLAGSGPTAEPEPSATD
jgi:hypothetical protein